MHPQTATGFLSASFALATWHLRRAAASTLAKTFGNGMATFNYVTTTWLIGADRPIYRLEGSFNSDSFSGYCAAFIGPGHHALACVIVSGLNPGDFDEDEAKEWASQIELSEAP